MSTADTLLAFLSRQDILLLFLLVGTGAIAGRVRLGSIELGAAAVLFIGMALSALGESRGYRIVVPEAFGTLGLVLFTFSVGNMSGASFFSSLRREYGAILATVAILIGGALIAVVGGQLLGLGSASVAGSFAGALTNTPALAAAREAAHDDAGPTIAYAVTYLFGVVGPASGLDPHISVVAAEYQVPRVARAGLPGERVRALARDATEGRTFGVLGEPRVNVLKLNLALDAGR